jgi:hypothetical protein
MPHFVPSAVLWLLNLNLGIALGAGLYESRMTVPQWLKSDGRGNFRWIAEAARDADVGLRFWVFVTTIPLTLLILASFAVMWWASPAVRFWWLIACGIALAERVMTFGYFIPTMIRLMRVDGPSGLDAGSIARRWASLGYVRHALTLMAWLAALEALSLL